MKKVKLVSLLASILILLSVFSCKKEAKNITVSGFVSDPQLKIRVEGANVSLLGSKIESGVYNPSYQVLGSAVTNSNGEFSFEVEGERIASYQVKVTKDKYFEFTDDLTAETFEANEVYARNYDIYPEATIEIIVKNTTPQSTEDKISYRLTNVEAVGRESCNNEPIIGIGHDFSNTTECKVRGNKTIKIEWVVTKKGNSKIYSDEIYCKVFEKTSFSINY